MTLLAAEDFRVVATVAVVFLIAMVLGYRLLNRDANVRRTRYGFFVERDRYNQAEKADEPGEPDEDDAPDAETKGWPERGSGSY